MVCLRPSFPTEAVSSQVLYGKNCSGCQKIELRLSSSYRPQSDGQTERVNQCLEMYLRCAVHACPTTWFHWLHLAEYWYNTSVHTAHGVTPFQVMFGRLPLEFGTVQVDQCTVTDLAAWLREREIMRVFLSNSCYGLSNA
jgi:hypothetical protein